jgi:hypothetical protein
MINNKLKIIKGKKGELKYSLNISPKIPNMVGDVFSRNATEDIFSNRCIECKRSLNDDEAERLKYFTSGLNFNLLNNLGLGMVL